MVLDIISHELPNDLSGGLVLRSAHRKELVAQIALHSDAKSRILHHADSVPNGYTSANRFVYSERTSSRRKLGSQTRLRAAFLFVIAGGFLEEAHERRLS